MLNMKKLSECGVTIIGGQIMSRVTASPEKGDEVIETRKVLVPKCIHNDGTISAEDMPEENLRITADSKKLTQPGDIVMKLSTPYDAGLVTAETEGAIVPSFCAILKMDTSINRDYLLAFLNSSTCKEQLRMQVSGAVMTVLSVGKIGSVEVPIPSPNEQHAIGSRFVETANRLAILQKIAELEAKRNDIVFKEMIKNHDEC